MAKQFLNLMPQIEQAIDDYVRKVKAGAFPEDKHGFAMDKAVVVKLKM